MCIDCMIHHAGFPEAMPAYFKPLAMFFAVAGVFGATPVFQANQIVQVTKDVLFQPLGWFVNSDSLASLVIGLVIAVMTSLIIFGGIKKTIPIRKFTSARSRIFPLYSSLSIISIFCDAYSGSIREVTASTNSALPNGLVMNFVAPACSAASRSSC